MQQKWNFNALEKTLSSPGLGAYRLLPTDSDQLILDRYTWNIALSESLYTPVSVFEVAFRNQIHHAAASKWGDQWIFNSKLVLEPMNRKVQDAVYDLQNNGKSVTPERVIAALSFGSWTAFFGHKYDKHFISHLLGLCFPNLRSIERRRSKIAAIVHTIRNFRNRLFHHEPIWKYRDLQSHHSRIVTTLGWMCTDTQDWLAAHDRFPKTYGEFLASNTLSDEE